MENAIQIENLSYTYREGLFLKPVTALRGITLSVPSGSCFGFLGHNGAGKTTTIKSILHLIHPQGTVRIFGHSSAETKARALLGYLPEQPYFYDYLTVQETVEFFATLSGVPRREVTQRARAALERVRIAPRANSRMRALSKGLTQRVGMAQAIVHSPKLLILDEPFSGLDPIGRREFRELIAELNSAGMTVFICTHVLSDVEYLCDEVAILAKGELRGQFRLDDSLFACTESYELIVTGGEVAHRALNSIEGRCAIEGELVRCEISHREMAERALQVALSQGLSIYSFEQKRATLEDIFVRLVEFEEAGSSEGVR